MDLKNDRINAISFNRLGTKMEIIEYTNAKNIIVKIGENDIRKTTYNKFKNGCIKSCYDKTIYSVGYIGSWDAPLRYKDKQSNEYIVWFSIMQRCYRPRTEKDARAYKEATVCEEWHNFQNFAKWYKENYYEIKDCRMQIDKDILVKGNKVYSPETCVFVPQQINNLFTKTDNIRGEFPIGVSYRKDKGQFSSRCNNQILNKRVHLGLYDTPDDAFASYKIYKESLIKEIAELYKNNIPTKLYNALYKYEVEITD